MVSASGTSVTQRSIDRVQIEPLRIERAADPGEHAFMLIVLRILDGGQELQVAHYATDIIGWRGTFSGNAQGIKPVRIWLGNGIDLDTMAPAVTEVVFVNELANGLAENAPERVFLFVQYIQIFHVIVSWTEGFFAKLEAVQMRVGPAHHELQQIVQLR